MTRLWIVLAAAALLPAAQTWTVRVEEPTGLYSRDNEPVAVPLARLGGNRTGFTVTDERGVELSYQLTRTELLFPASLIPGELPRYRISCCTAVQTNFTNPILFRRLGQWRVEFGNPQFRAVIDLKTAAIVEAYALHAGPQRILNLVETTPEGPDALKGDVHEDTPQAKTFSPPPVPGVDGPNSGWTSLGGSGPFEKVELVEPGPLRARLRLTSANEAWEITWTANGAGFEWKASRGFRFTAISAAPYLPFNRCLDGDDHNFPSGPEASEPPSSEVAARRWTQLPGGHIVYYQKEANYAALGIVALDASLRWTGACSRRVLADRGTGPARVAIAFPKWKGNETVMEARREYRIITGPLLASVSGPSETAAAVKRPAPRIPSTVVSNRPLTPFTPYAFSLDGEWELAFSEKGNGPPQSGWKKVHVPGSVHTQWLSPQSLYTRDAEWVSRKEWWYRRTFQAPAGNPSNIHLQFDATDYYADTWLNGEFLGRHEGYIDPYSYPVKTRPGENTILVRVWTPVSYYWKHRPYTIKGAYGAVDQKPDDITALGITRSVRLQPSAIRDVAVNTRLHGTQATVELDLEAEATDGLVWEATLTPRNFQSADRYQVRLPAASRRLTIPVKNPRLWWTRDHGEPSLYTLDLRLLDAKGRAVDGRSLAVGIREIEKVGWNFYLNGKRIFIRGTNYYYHLFMSEMTREKYERDLKLMMGMNINMIRLHCHFSNREFYDLADENGILLWQDFLEAWYPQDTRFSVRAAALYDNHIRYARNHPSIALWATSDEEDFVNYHDLTKHLAARPSLLDPQRRPVVRSTGRFGDSHVYHGWYNGTIWQYRNMTQSFVSELGATSLPNYETLIQFLPNHWPIGQHEDEWVWRRLQITEAFRAWGSPEGKTLREYIPQTQAYVARLFQIAIERMRRRKSDGAGGILHFHAIDIWPSVTMAAIDFNRVPTLVYDTVRRSFEPVAALFDYDRDDWKTGEAFHCDLWAVNDRLTPVQGAQLRWQIRGPIETKSVVVPVSLPSDSVSKAAAADARLDIPGDYALHAEILDAADRVISENIFRFRIRS
ncbi:MAG: beta galactosidase jelly roll domain-containing protein [Acidobacteria bacterium]|nr:beta galactosidase jelly roll domain-containing protein [Acidobacteriota bacterium]